MGAKPFKVASLEDDRRYGLAARSLEELVRKGCRKWQLPQKGCRVCLFEDGTEIDADYFYTLNDHCEVIILKEGQQWNGGLHYCINKVLNTFYANSEELTQIASQMLSDEKSFKKRVLLQNLIQKSNENISAENREDDLKWFEGLDLRFKTKSDYMRFSCGKRMRNYLTEVKNHGKILEGKMQLKKVGFVITMAILFARDHLIVYRVGMTIPSIHTVTRRTELSSALGIWITGRIRKLCRGCREDLPDCCLDWKTSLMRIEKKRTIIPDIVKAVLNQNIDNDKVEKFYKHLFTVENLKLVHVVCHKKCKHNLSF
ncbi:DNA fragmentation factor subunit beta isoform X2 [Narcine bancroftii]|uniref:DNA fragmentation factor subunit beta isoform X2 n=1 Tax=Narcine bancroftii TaxID=1343680 RepID=UPI0038320B95